MAPILRYSKKKVEDPPALIHFLTLKKSQEEYNINDSKNVVLECTENHGPFVKQSRVAGLLGQLVRPL